MTDINNNIKPVNVIFYYTINNIEYEYNLNKQPNQNELKLYKKLKNKKIYDKPDYTEFIDKSGNFYVSKIMIDGKKIGKIYFYKK